MKLILKAIRNMIDGVYHYVDNIIAKATNVAYVYTLLIEEQTVAIDVDSSEEYDYESLDGGLYLEQGKVYAVTLNGKTYTCTAWYLEYWESVCLGNGSVIGQEGGDDAPFLIDSYPDGSIYLEVASSGEYTISISSVEEGNRTLDKKYLPEDAKSDWNQNDPTAPDHVKNRPFWTGDPVDTVLFEGTVVNHDAPEIELIVGQEYTVTLDGVEYVLAAWEVEEGLVAIGSRSLVLGEDYDDTEPPFMIVVFEGDSVFATVNEGEEHTLRIVAKIAEIHKIDEKYLSDRILEAIDTSKTTAEIAEMAKDTAKTAYYTANMALDHYRANSIVYFTTTDQKTYTATLNGSSKAFLSGYIEYPANLIDGEIFATLYVNDIYIGNALGITGVREEAIKVEEFVIIETIDYLLYAETPENKQLVGARIFKHKIKDNSAFNGGIKTIKLVFSNDVSIPSNSPMYNGLCVYSTVA